MGNVKEVRDLKQIRHTQTEQNNIMRIEMSFKYRGDEKQMRKKSSGDLISMFIFKVFLFVFHL